MEEHANTKQANAVTQKRKQKNLKRTRWYTKSNEMVDTQGRQNGPEETTENMQG